MDMIGGNGELVGTVGPDKAKCVVFKGGCSLKWKLCNSLWAWACFALFYVVGGGGDVGPVRYGTAQLPYTPSHRTHTKQTASL